MMKKLIFMFIISLLLVSVVSAEEIKTWEPEEGKEYTITYEQKGMTGRRAGKHTYKVTFAEQAEDILIFDVFEMDGNKVDDGLELEINQIIEINGEKMKVGKPKPPKPDPKPPKPKKKVKTQTGNSCAEMATAGQASAAVRSRKEFSVVVQAIRDVKKDNPKLRNAQLSGAVIKEESNAVTQHLKVTGPIKTKKGVNDPKKIHACLPWKLPQTVYDKLKEKVKSLLEKSLKGPSGQATELQAQPFNIGTWMMVLSILAIIGLVVVGMRKQ